VAKYGWKRREKKRAGSARFCESLDLKKRQYKP
jgi:hypothetical protein